MEDSTSKRIERSDLLDLPEFWAIHYYLLLKTEDCDSADLVEPFFGVSNQFANDYYVEHFDKIPWPFFRIPLPHGFAIEVEYALEPDSEIRFNIDNESWESSVVLGYDSGHSALPALQWSEVERIGTCISKTAELPIHRRSGLLLFFPGAYVTKGDDTDTVRSSLCEAWNHLGSANSDSIPQLVDNVIAYRSIDSKWWRDDELGWINDSRYSLRNPETLMCDFDRTKFERIKDFFEMIDSFS